MTFAEELLAATGTAADAFDIRAIVRRCFFYDFDGFPVRLWEGIGKLHAGGYEWLGTFTPDGDNRHQAPATQDARDGASPKYEFSLPYIDRATFLALKADQALAKGRTLTVYHVICLPGEGLRPGTALRFDARYIMQGVQFSEALEGEAPTITRRYSAAVQVSNLEFGRSLIPNGTYTDAAQNFRAQQLGLASDSGCSFVAANSRRTYVVGG